LESQDRDGFAPNRAFGALAFTDSGSMVLSSHVGGRCSRLSNVFISAQSILFVFVRLGCESRGFAASEIVEVSFLIKEDILLVLAISLRRSGDTDVA